MSKEWKRLFAIVLSLAMTVSTTSVSVFASESIASEEFSCEHHEEHSEECGYEQTGSCNFVCDLCVEQKEDNSSEEMKKLCSCTALCTENSINANCLLCSKDEADLALCTGKEQASPATMVVQSWEWAGESAGLSEGVLTLTDIGTDNPVTLSMILSKLPNKITASIENKQEEIELNGWTCPEYIQDEQGNWPQSGEYIFTTVLPEGYSLAEGVNGVGVKVQLNGLTTLADTTKEVSYLDENGEMQTVQATPLTDTMTSLSSGWYVVDSQVTMGSVSMPNRADVNLILADGCVLTLNGTLSVSEWMNNKLTIYAQSTGSSMGKLVAKATTEDYAAIGGTTSNCGTLIIHGGNISATSSGYGAAIGGGKGKNGGNITITGGIVTATSNGKSDQASGGAAIGGGSSKGGSNKGGDGGNITISGGKVTALANVSGGAGIGGGSGSGSGEAGSGGNITISGGTVIAESTKGGAGIGGGSGSNAIAGKSGNIIITGGNITATSSAKTVGMNSKYSGAGIGSGHSATAVQDTGTITIEGGTVTASSAEQGAGIGGGKNVSAGNIIVKGGTIKATGGSKNEFDIGNGYNAPEPSEIQITGGTICNDENVAAKTSSRPTNGKDLVYYTVADLTSVYGVNSPVNNIDGTDYDFTDVSTDQNGKIHIYLPTGSALISFDGEEYSGIIASNDDNKLTNGIKGTAPSITVQPENQIVEEGQTAIFRIEAAGDPVPSYQWQINKDDGSSWKDISGETEPSCTIANATTDMNGYQYRCIVTNSVGSVTSKVVVLVVNAPVPTEYTITVENDGNGSASATPATAEEGTKITLSTIASPGYYFKEWQVASGNIRIDTDNTFIMPAENVIVKAIFEKNAPVQYTVTVNGSYAGSSSGTGQYKEGQIVTIHAGIRSNYVFDGWTSSNDIVFADASNSSTTFTMPGKSVTVTANWRYTGGNPSGSNTGSSGNNSGNEETKPNRPSTSEKTESDGSTINHSTKPVITNTDAKKEVYTGNKQVEIGVKSFNTNMEVTLEAQALNTLIKNKTERFTIITNKEITITFNQETLEKLDKVSKNKDVILRVEKTSVASNKVKKIIGTHPTYQVSLAYLENNKEVAVKNLDTNGINVTIPYTLKKGEIPGNLCVMYINEGNIIPVPVSSYNVSQKAVSFQADQCGTYAVAYKAPDKSYSDIQAHWAKDDILFVVSRNLLIGADDKFNPDTAVTGGEVVEALAKLSGQNKDFIVWAQQKGIIGNEFNEKNSMTNEQIAVLFNTYCTKQGIVLPKTIKEMTFADEKQIDEGAQKAVKAMQQAGVMFGIDNNCFAPNSVVTRAQFASILRNFVEMKVNVQSANGWKKNSIGQTFYFENGKKMKGWKMINNKWYYFQKDGSMAVNTNIGNYKVGADGSRQ